MAEAYSYRRFFLISFALFFSIASSYINCLFCCFSVITTYLAYCNSSLKCSIKLSFSFKTCSEVKFILQKSLSSCPTSLKTFCLCFIELCNVTDDDLLLNELLKDILFKESFIKRLSVSLFGCLLDDEFRLMERIKKKKKWLLL